MKTNFLRPIGIYYIISVYKYSLIFIHHIIEFIITVVACPLPPLCCHFNEILLLLRPFCAHYAYSHMSSARRYFNAAFVSICCYLLYTLLQSTSRAYQHLKLYHIPFWSLHSAISSNSWAYIGDISCLRFITPLSSQHTYDVEFNTREYTHRLTSTHQYIGFHQCAGVKWFVAT